MPYKDPAVAKAKAREKYLRNREAYLAKATQWAKDNREKRDANYKAWAAKNKDAVRKATKRFYAANPDKGAAKTAQYRAAKANRVPSWFGELDELVLSEAAHLAQLRQKTTTVKWHVDHIIPLRGALVSGLHAWNNIQLLPALVNMSKGNRIT
jgi:5-methylcytosine-specific restriction endonuclease McrA